MAVSRTYIDSYYLLELILDGKEKSDVEHLLSQTSNPSFNVLIPQVVLGEVTAKIMKDEQRRIEHKLNKMADVIQKYRIDTNMCLTPPSKAAFEIMVKLQEIDKCLDSTDTMILAQVLADPHSKFFLTHDSKLLKNNKIKEYEKTLRSECRKERLKITERIR